jgi:short-subunit dehydrogenase
MNYLIFGATSNVAKEFISYVIQKEKDAKFILSSSSEKRLKVLKKSLLRKKVLISLVKIDFNNLNYNKLKDLRKILNNNSYKFINHIYFFNSFTKVEAGKVDKNYINKSINVNAVAVIKIINYLLDDIIKFSISLNYISSISLIRPRKKNYIYSSSKIMVEQYLKSLMHLFKFKAPYVKIYRLGFLKSKKNNNFLSVDCANVAKYLQTNQSKNKNFLVYFPFKWKILSYIINFIPNFFYKKINL